MDEKTTAYLRKQMHKTGIAKQYLEEAKPTKIQYDDPLQEEYHEVVKGLVHKFQNRALIKVSYQCAAHCRFCTRIRQIGDVSGTLTSQNIQQIAGYLALHPEIEDVILSGGDPFMTPKITSEILQIISPIKTIKVIRIGTRLPFQNPGAFSSEAIKSLLAQIKTIREKRPFYILLHVNHPDELTHKALQSVRLIQEQTSAILLSQTVFLEGINIDYQVLKLLFKDLYFAGITPYYLYHCDRIKGLEHFVGDLKKEKRIMQLLRKNLSGIAVPKFVIETYDGKFPVDLGYSVQMFRDK